MINLYFQELKSGKVDSTDFIKKVYQKHTKMNPEKIIIKRTLRGKPYLENDLDFHFNISHSKGAIICGVSKEPIGVDMELIKPYKPKITHRFFTKAEQEYILSDNNLVDLRFAEIWTKKEAYVKLLGVGLEKDFASFDVLGREDIFNCTNKGYSISVCSNKFGREQTTVVVEKVK